MKNRIVQKIVLIVTFVIAIIAMTGNTEKIVLHWGVMGDVTSYGSRYYIIFLPVISVLLYMLFRRYEKNPKEFYRFPNGIPSDKVTAVASYVRTIALLTLLMLLYVTLCSAQMIPFHPYIIIAIILLMMVYYIRTYRRLSKS